MMRKFRGVTVVVVAGLVLMAGILLFWWWRPFAPPAPGFRRIPAGAGATGMMVLGYDFLNPKPCVNGLLWLYAARTNQAMRTFLFDVPNRQLVGEFEGTMPALFNADGTRILCATVDRRPPNPFFARLQRIVRRISGTQFIIQQGLMETGTCWMLDVSRGAFAEVGSFRCLSGAVVRFNPSPAAGFAYLVPFQVSTAWTNVHVFDLNLGKSWIDKIPGHPEGWWDESQIICRGSNGDWLLHDIHSHKQTSLLRSADLADFLGAHQITEGAQSFQVLDAWGGPAQRLYLSVQQNHWLASTAPLLSLSRVDRSLRLEHRMFKFEWSDHLDHTGQWYLYSGREVGQRSDGVYLRNLAGEPDQTLVRETGAPVFSMPRFSGDSVIYVRSNALWRVELGMNNPHQIFPPIENQRP